MTPIELAPLRQAGMILREAENFYHGYIKEASAVLLECRDMLNYIAKGGIVAEGAEVTPKRIAQVVKHIGFTTAEHEAGKCDCEARVAAGETEPQYQLLMEIKDAPVERGGVPVGPTRRVGEYDA